MDSVGGVALADILADMNRLRASPDRRDAVVALLAEQSPIYAGRSTAEAERLRGYLLASLNRWDCRRPQCCLSLKRLKAVSIPMW